MVGGGGKAGSRYRSCVGRCERHQGSSAHAKKTEINKYENFVRYLSHASGRQRSVRACVRLSASARPNRSSRPPPSSTEQEPINVCNHHLNIYFFLNVLSKLPFWGPCRVDGRLEGEVCLRRSANLSDRSLGLRCCGDTTSLTPEMKDESERITWNAKPRSEPEAPGDRTVLRWWLQPSREAAGRSTFAGRRGATKELLVCSTRDALLCAGHVAYVSVRGAEVQPDCLQPELHTLAHCHGLVGCCNIKVFRGLIVKSFPSLSKGMLVPLYHRRRVLKTVVEPVSPPERISAALWFCCY